MCLLVSRTVLWPRMLGLYVGGVGVGVYLGLDGRIVRARAPRTQAWIGVPRGVCSPSLK